MAYRSITPDQAATEMAGGRAIYLDVRSQREFAAGHPKGAINIPIMEPNSWGQLALNEEFLVVVEKILPRDANLVIGCRSGRRSEAACQILAESGYTNLANVKGGFGGARDMLGRVSQAGWVELGLPVANDNGDGVSYESLRKKALG